MCYRSRVEFHFKLLQVEPLLWLGGVQVMVKISRCVTKAVELLVRAQQNGGRCLLVGHPRVSALPTPSNRSTSTNSKLVCESVCVCVQSQREYRQNEEYTVDTCYWIIKSLTFSNWNCWRNPGVKVKYSGSVLLHLCAWCFKTAGRSYISADVCEEARLIPQQRMK